MLGAFVIVLREVIEAGLIVGIVLAATRGIPGRGRWVGMGVSKAMATEEGEESDACQSRVIRRN